METTTTTSITVATTVGVPVEKAWKIWTSPEHITQWNTATPEWHTPKAENDLRVGGRFTSRMEAKDGSFGFDFGGTYDEVKTNELISYTLDDNRKVQIVFEAQGQETQITETFEAEQTNPVEMQQGGWQAILNNFKQYAENIA